MFGSRRNRAVGEKISRGQRNFPQCLWVQGTLQHHEPLYRRGHTAHLGTLCPSSIPARGTLGSLCALQLPRWYLELLSWLRLTQSRTAVPCHGPHLGTSGISPNAAGGLQLWLENIDMFRNIDNTDPPLHNSWIPAPVPSSPAASASAAQHPLGGLSLLMGHGDRKNPPCKARQGCVSTECDPVTPRVRNSFVLPQTALFRKAQAGFEDTQC